VHEFGYVESLLPVLEERAAGRTVVRLGVRAGVLHRLVDESFQQAFDTVAAGTVAEGAAVELTQVPVDVRCLGCGHTAEADQELGICPECGSTEVVNEDGSEFTLHWVAFAGG
jgi:hydrogenase nickel incorporation protein HypA/HybF